MPCHVCMLYVSPMNERPEEYSDYCKQAYEDLLKRHPERADAQYIARLRDTFHDGMVTWGCCGKTESEADYILVDHCRVCHGHVPQSAEECPRCDRNARPEWGKVAHFPQSKYRIVEVQDGWDVYSRDYEMGKS